MQEGVDQSHRPMFGASHFLAKPMTGSPLAFDTVRCWNVGQILTNQGSYNILRGEHLKGWVSPPGLHRGPTVVDCRNMPPRESSFGRSRQCRSSASSWIRPSFLQNCVDFLPEIVKKRRRVLVPVWPDRPQPVSMSLSPRRCAPGPCLSLTGCELSKATSLVPSDACRVNE